MPSLPPSTKAGGPATAEPPTAPTDALVAGATGGGATMPTNLGNVLQQLVDAVALLSKSISSMGAVGGGGPVQMPPFNPGQVPPGKLDPIQGGGGSDIDPVSIIGPRLDQMLASRTLSPESRSALEAIKANEFAKVRAEAAATGSFNPVSLVRPNILISIQEAAGDTQRRTSLEALMPRLDAIQARADREGAFNPVDLQELDLRVRDIMAGSPPPMP